MWCPRNRVIYFFKESLPSAVDLLEDGIGVSSPLVSGGFEVVVIEKAEDIGDELRNAFKAAQADNLAGNFSEEAFHKIEPRGGGWSEMKVNAFSA